MITSIADELERLAKQLRSYEAGDREVVIAASPGRRLMLARNKLNLSQKDLASLSGVSAGAIMNFEAGKTQPRPRTLMALAPHVELEWEELLDADAD